MKENYQSHVFYWLALLKKTYKDKLSKPSVEKNLIS